MILKCEGIQIGRFKIPPFELYKGDMICIALYGGSHFFDLVEELNKLFSGKKEHSKIKHLQKLEYVEHFKENKLRSRFCPTTVKQYHKKKANSQSEIQNRIFEEVDYITPKTRINTLAGNPRKWMALFTTLSRTQNIMFDLVGQDPLGAKQTLMYVREYINNEGAAILLDNFDGKEPECTKYYTIEVTDN